MKSSPSYGGSPEHAPSRPVWRKQHRFRSPLLLLMVSPWGQEPSGQHSDMVSTC